METECCAGCHLVLRDPFVECRDCQSTKPLICLDCFSKGREFGDHKNFHAYKIVKKDFAPLEADWTADEELLLLNALLQRGHGNWEDIARVLINKSPQQCEQHFGKIYVENGSGRLLDSWKKSKCYRRRDQPVNFHSPLDVPPRPGISTQPYKELGGYNAARGDFDHEMDSLAERDLDDVEFDVIKVAVEEFQAGKRLEDVEPSELDSEEGDKRLEANLQLAVVEVYNNKLKMRARVKRIIGEMGLLNKSKVAHKTNLYHTLLQAGPGYSQLLKYGQLMCAFDFDYILESMQHEMNLRQQILHLQEYRHNGLTKFVSTAFFSKLRHQREKNQREVARSNDTVQDWTQSKARINYVQDKTTGTIIPTTNRRSALPLDVVGMPGYEKLTAEERELCSDIRVYPEMFLEIRHIMINECIKNNGLRLADARPVVKIDVNKTRKIYDYFVETGDIFKPASRQ